MKLIYRLYWRLNVILGYPFLLFSDFMLAVTSDRNYHELREDSMNHIKINWYKY